MAAVHACPVGYNAVGLDINANHISIVRSGWVTGTARAIHIGTTTQVWYIEMVDDAGKLSCVSRRTMSIFSPRDTDSQR